MWDERGLPHPDADEWEWLLFRQHQVLGRTQALKFLAGKVIDRRVGSGKWQRVHRGVYVTHNGPLTTTQRLWVASLAVGDGSPALLAGVSALEVLGLRHFTTPLIHVLLPARRRDNDPPAGVRVHRTTRLPRTDVDLRAEPPCTQAARSVVDAAQWARTDREARTIIAMSFQQRLVGGDEIGRVLGQFAVLKRRALIARTAADANDGSETLGELDLVRLCRAEGLPVPNRQVVRTDSAGRKRYLDAYFDQWGIRVEVDGAHHMEAEHWWSDMQRHNALAVTGEVLLRFPAWVVRHQPSIAGTAIRDALVAAGWPSG